ncbi:MAG: metalloregulator ArsR/SmtB family transcription factor [Chromatiales bacterium]|nr:metalloregulator ArsR/SmtB family transcription factor [Chromatiales bacterium]
MNPTLLFKALSDTTRLRCMMLLAQHQELCVCELTYALGLPQPKISHHLAALRRAGLVNDRKEGLWIYYSLNPDVDAWVRDVLRSTAEGISKQQPFSEDVADLLDMPNRPGGICSA